MTMIFQQKETEKRNPVMTGNKPNDPFVEYCVFDQKSTVILLRTNFDLKRGACNSFLPSENHAPIQVQN